jgi:hypothetical protein
LATRPPRRTLGHMDQSGEPSQTLWNEWPGATTDERAAFIHTWDFLRDAHRGALLDDETYGLLQELLERRWNAAVLEQRRRAEALVRLPEVLVRLPEAPPPPSPSAAPFGFPPRPDAAPTRLRPPVVAEGSPRIRPASAKRRVGTPLTVRARGLRDLVASDFGLHGLAYLGVLLTFAGTFGFVFFAFGSVQRGLRPLAELAIPTVALGSGWFLRRRGRALVPAGLELLGGALLPVVLFASLVDRAPVPPDPSGAALIAGLVFISVALAAGYAVWSRRREASLLGYLVGPLVWTAAMAAGLAFVGYPVEGVAIESPSARQMALVCVAVVASVAIAAQRKGHRLSRPTMVAAVPGIVIAYLLTLLVARAEGWPALPVAVAGAALIVTSELLATRFGRAIASPAVHALATGATLAACSPGWGAGRTGVATVVLFVALFEWAGHRGWPLAGSRLLSVAGAAVGLAVSLAEGWTVVAAWGVATVWVHARRTRLPARPYVIDVAAAVVPTGVAAGLLRAAPVPVAFLAMASMVAGTAVAVRALRVSDRFWEWWLPVAAGAIAVGTMVARQASPAASPAMLAASAGLAGLTMLVAIRSGALRTWAAGAAFAAAVHLSFDALNVAPRMLPAAWSLTGLAVVVAASPQRAKLSGHVAAIGHLVSLGAVASSPSAAAPALVLAGWTAGWAVQTAVNVSVGSPLVGLLERLADSVSALPAERWLRRALHSLPERALVASFPFLVVRIGARFPSVLAHPGWAGVELAAVALIYAAIAGRIGFGRPVGQVLADASLAVSVFAMLRAWADPWPAIETVAASIAAVALVGRELRRAPAAWFAWALSMVLAAQVGSLAGVSAPKLHLVSLAMGAVLLSGGLLADDLLSGRRSSGQWIRSPWLVPPVVLGATGATASFVPFFWKAPDVLGWWCLAGAAFSLLVAVQLRAGWVSGLGYALAAVAYADLAPWHPWLRPWTFAPWAGVLIALSFVSQPKESAVESWLRWDLAPLVVAHCVAAVALVRSVVLRPEDMAAAWMYFGALSLVIAAGLGRWEWAAGGALLVLVGARAAGPSWLAGSLAAVSAGTAFAASRNTGPVRAWLQGTSMATAGGAWLELIRAAGWSPATAMWASAAGFGAMAVLTTIALRTLALAKDWALALEGLSVAGVGGAALTSLVAIALADLGLATTSIGTREAEFAIGVGTLLLAVAAGLSAQPFGQRRLRDAAAFLALTAGKAFMGGMRFSLSWEVAVAAGAGFLGTIAALALWRREPQADWLQPAHRFAAGATAGSLALATAALPHRGPLVGALLIAGLLSAAVGLTMRRRSLLLVSPTLFCAAWLLFASESLAGNAEWFTVPIGITLLVTLEMARAERRRLEIPVSTPELVALEYMGVAFVAGAALAQTITVSPAYGLLGVCAGIGLMGWAAVTRVRRRAAVGAGVVLMSVFLLVAAPIARAIPEVHGAALWIALASVGAGLIALATAVEWGRARVRAAVAHLAELVAGWE